MKYPGQWNSRRRGMALMIVVGAISVASLLALAMLSSSSLHAQMGNTLSQIAKADYLAESGVHYAIYQLRKTAASDEVYAGGTHSFGEGDRERFVVTVTRKPGSATHYDIVSRGEVLNSYNEVVASKTAVASVKATAELKYGQAAILGASETQFPTNGGMFIETVVAKRVAVEYGNFIYNIIAQSVSGAIPDYVSVVLTNKFPYRITPKPAIRTFQDAPYLYTDGNLYWAERLPSSALSNVTLGPTPNNPAGVYYHDGNVILNGNVKIKGTLVVLNGSLRLNFANNEIDGSGVNSRKFPALVVRDGSILSTGIAMGRLLEVKGATWIGKNIEFGNFGLPSEMYFRGVVILPTGRIASNATVTMLSRIFIYHDPDTSDIPRLDRELISDVEILTWTSP